MSKFAYCILFPFFHIIMNFAHLDFFHLFKCDKNKRRCKLFNSLHWLYVICIIGLSIEFQFVGDFRQYDGISMKFVVYCWIECRNVVYWNERRECVCLCLNTYPCISLFNQTEATCKDELLAQYQNQTSTSEYKTIFVDIHTLWFCSLCDQSFFLFKKIRR